MSKDTATLLSEISTKFPNNTTGQITATILRDFLADTVDKLPTEWFVDSVTGLDTNDGKGFDTPYRTIAKLLEQTLRPGDKIYLARGSYWRERLFSAVNYLTVEAYGNGARPILDASDIVSNASFTVPTAGRTKAYELLWTPLYGSGVAGGDLISIWENGTRLVRQSSIANCEANPGSFFAAIAAQNVQQTIYVHPTGTTDPRANGNIYEVIKRQNAIQLRNNCTIRSLHCRRNGGNDGAILLELNALIVDCLAEDGTKHNAFARSGEFRDCVFWKAEDGASHYNGTLAVFYANDPTQLTGIFRRCSFVGNLNGVYPNGLTGYTVHGQNDNVYFKTVIIEDCKFSDITAFGQGKVESLYIRGCELFYCDFAINTLETNKLILVENCKVNSRITTNFAMQVNTFPNTFISVRGCSFFSSNFKKDVIRIFGTGSVFFDYCTFVGQQSTGIHTGAGAANAATVAVFNSVFDGCFQANLLEAAGTVYNGDRNFFSFPDPTALQFTEQATIRKPLQAYKLAKPEQERNSLSGNARLITNPETSEIRFANESPVHSLKIGHSYWLQRRSILFSPQTLGEAQKLLTPSTLVAPTANTVIPNSATFAPNTVGAISWWTPRRAVTVQGSNITQLTDQIGTNHLAQATIVNSPILAHVDSDVLNFPVVVFNGYSFLKTPSITLTHPFFVIMVVQIQRPKGVLMDGFSNNTANVSIGSNATGYTLDVFGGAYFQGRNISLNNYCIVSLLFNTTASKTWINGGTSVNGSSAATAPNNNGLTIGTNGGNAIASCSFFRMAELILVNRDITTDEHNYLGTNLGHIYGGLPWIIPT